MANQIYDILNKLLEPINEMENFLEDPETIAEQFMRWINHVKTALEGANLNVEAQMWKDACSRIKFSPYETSQTVQMSSMKAILQSFIYKYSTDEISEELFDMQIFEGIPPYIYRIAVQANGCYERGWFDASLVMIRRLLESLLIECFENYKIEFKIKKNDDNYFQLGEILSTFITEDKWNLSRSTRKLLPKLIDIKGVADESAHNRRFLATKRDIDKYIKDMRICFQEIVYISQEKKT